MHVRIGLSLLADLYLTFRYRGAELSSADWRNILTEGGGFSLPSALNSPDGISLGNRPGLLGYWAIGLLGYVRSSLAGELIESRGTFIHCAATKIRSKIYGYANGRGKNGKRGSSMQSKYSMSAG